MKVLGLIVAAWFIAAACGAAGIKIGVDGAETRITQDCAADGYFDVTRDGVSWRYTCSDPKLYGVPGID